MTKAFRKSFSAILFAFPALFVTSLILGQAGPAFSAVTKTPENKSALAAAKEAFQNKQYDKAIILYRKHLRQNKKDLAVWNEIAASYYHSGLPKRALRYLKSVAKKSTPTSYNLFYQGLCYSALDMKLPARKSLAEAARFTDEYGSRATFELALLEYNDRNVDPSRYWLLLYQQRYPQGVYAKQVAAMLDGLKKGTFIKDVKGMEKPDVDNALYRYSPLSLTSTPHYWFTQLGYNVTNASGQEPTQDGGVKPVAVGQQGILANFGIGIGPAQSGDTTAWGGYTYRQMWWTDDDRLQTFLDDPGDFEYQPFRADLLIRTHQFYADLRRKIWQSLYAGVYGRIEFSRTGSTFFPAPREDAELKKTLRVSDTTLLLPWVGLSYYKNFHTVAYLYFRKELNAESPEFSNKTYLLSTSGGGPAISFGISQDAELPAYKTVFNLELFQYEFVFNDYWLDYTRDGGIIGVSNEFIPNFLVDAFFGFYQDTYQLPRLKMRSSCATVDAANASVTDAASPTRCPRTDTGIMYQVGIYWNYSPFHRLGFSYEHVENQNKVQKEFDESSDTYKVTATIAFPNVRRVMRFVNRYGDSAFTKENE